MANEYPTCSIGSITAEIGGYMYCNIVILYMIWFAILLIVHIHYSVDSNTHVVGVVSFRVLAKVLHL